MNTGTDAARRSKDVEHLAKEPPARIELLQLGVVGIVAVLGDQRTASTASLPVPRVKRVGDRRA